MKKPKPLIDRLTASTLAKLRTRKMTNAEAAILYEVSETYMSRIVASIQDKEPAHDFAARKAASKIFKARMETRAMLAKQVNKGEITLAKAMKQANCTERTIRRYMALYAKAKK